MAKDEGKPYDIVVFGATSFVGRLLCHYLNAQYGATGGTRLRWAAAGRSREKLERLCDALEAQDLPLVTANTDDDASLEALCAQTRVVVSTVGPYALHGEPMIRACVASGTDYCDLSGEPHWIRRMIETYEVQAKETGARIVHCCGFDSLPSDLGVLFLQQASQQRFGAPCTRISMRVKAIRGSFSGGTIASMVNFSKEMRADPALRDELANPYSLCPGGYRPIVSQPYVKNAAYDSRVSSWIAPFIMASINTRVVQRSNALSNQAYGESFQYDEAMMTGDGVRGRLRAYGLAAGLSGFLAGVALKPTRALLERFVLPKPGDGPTTDAQEKGFYDVRFYGETDKKQMLIAQVVGDRDPGYGSTSKMLGEAALCLAREISESPVAGGFWTPATIFGSALVDRLEANAGVHFEIRD